MDGKNGFIVPTNNEGTIAERRWELLSDPELHRRLGQSGRKCVEMRIDLGAYARKVVYLCAWPQNGN